MIVYICPRVGDIDAFMLKHCSYMYVGKLLIFITFSNQNRVVQDCPNYEPFRNDFYLLIT